MPRQSQNKSLPRSNVRNKVSPVRAHRSPDEAHRPNHHRCPAAVQQHKVRNKSLHVQTHRSPDAAHQHNHRRFSASCAEDPEHSYIKQNQDSSVVVRQLVQAHMSLTHRQSNIEHHSPAAAYLQARYEPKIQDIVLVPDCALCSSSSPIICCQAYIGTRMGGEGV